MISLCWASAFTRQDAGYIDNVVQNIKGINEGEAYGGRLAGLWKPSDNFSLKFGAIYQHSTLNGIPEVNESNSAYYSIASQYSAPLAAKLYPALGDLQQNYVAGVDRTTSSTQVYSLNLKYNFGAIDLSSNTGYSNVHTVSPLDISLYYSPTFIQQGYAGIGAPLITDYHLHKLTEEVQLSGGAGSRIDWAVGGFYAHESESPQYQQWIYETDLVSGRSSGTFWYDFIRDTYSERAAFGNLTYHFTDQFDVQVGARESHVEENGSQITGGPYVPLFLHETPPLYNSGSASSDAFTYLLTPEFKFSHDLMMYARLASGFRPGSFNANPIPGIPSEFSPDKTYNYELGLKGKFFDDRLTVDASVYHIDWRNLQITLVKDNYSYGTNGSKAKSEGVEFSFSAQPLTGLTIAGWSDYNHAVLVEDFPSSSPVYGVAGNQLPSAPKYSAQLSIQQSFPLFAKATGSLAAVVNYTGDRLGTFIACAAPTVTGACPVPPSRQDYPAFARTDLRANVQYGSWAWTFYANNVADIRGILSGGGPYFIPYAFNIIQPRTVGLNLAKTF
jgi:iron complex outermembrane receptor protein